MEEMKPYCLHCGKLMRSYPHQGYWWFQCSACGAESPHVWHGTERDAIEAWNRRPAPENKPLTLEQLRQMDGEPVYAIRVEADEEKDYKSGNGWYLVNVNRKVLCQSIFKGIAFEDLNVIYDTVAGKRRFGYNAYARKPEQEETK